MKQRYGGGGARQSKKGGARVRADKRKRGQQEFNLDEFFGTYYESSAGGGGRGHGTSPGVARTSVVETTARLGSRHVDFCRSETAPSSRRVRRIGLIGLFPSTHGNSRRNWAYLNSRLDYPSDLDK